MCVLPVELQYWKTDNIVKTYALLDSCWEILLYSFGAKYRNTPVTIKTLNGMGHKQITNYRKT